MKELARRIIPLPIWARLRVLKIRYSVARFSTREVNHTYSGFPIKVRLADPLAQGWYDKDWPELEEIALLREGKLRPGATVFDLGAHYGVVALILERIVRPDGLVVAVEASPHNFRMAEETRNLNSASCLRVVHSAVSDRSEALIFGQGLNARADDGTGAWGRVAVPAVTIDELAGKYGMPDVLFLDVEGFECRVLRGARQVLSRRPDCFVEVHAGQGLEDFGGSVPEILSFFPGYRFLVATEEDRRFREAREGQGVPLGRFFLVARADGEPGSGSGRRA